MYDGAYSCDLPESDTNNSEAPTHAQMLGATALYEEQAGAEARVHGNTVNESDPPINELSSQRRISKVGAQALTFPARRSRLHKQLETCDSQEKGTLTPSMRKKYLKDLFLNHSSHSGLSNILSLQSASQTSKDCEDETGATWALDPTEHAWTLSVVDGNYDTMMQFLSEDPGLLTRKDFISGYTALHWLAKNGKHETLIKLLKRAEKEGCPVNVNLKGSGGLTPLHVAAMHSQYMVIKILVGAFGADVNTMDYNGKRAWQYLKETAPPEMKELLGAWDDEYAYWQLNANNNCAGADEASPVVESQKVLNVVDTFKRPDVWLFGSFRKLLTPFMFGGKK